MKIEILYPELCNVFGDLGNMKFLRQCLPEAEVVSTAYPGEPAFLKERVDMLYMGSMPLTSQRFALERLREYRERLWQRIEEGMVVLFTGNALELLGKSVRQGERMTEGLGYFDFEARIDTDQRHNSMFLGTFGELEVVGYRSQFSFSYGTFDHPFLQVTGGIGTNPELKTEGIHYKNLFAIYLLGPFLVQNPLFVRHLMGLLGAEHGLAFEKEAMEAYRYRLEQLKAPGAMFVMAGH